MTKLLSLNDHVTKEIRIFRTFAEKSPCGIDFNTIEKRYPPEPDIFCKSLYGDSISFELVECLDSNIARSIYDTSDIKQAFCKQLQKLPIRKRQSIEIFFEDASITVAFCKGTPEIRKQQLIPLIFDFLHKIAANKEEREYHAVDFPNLKSVIERLSIKRGFENGPLFQIAPEPVWFSDTSIERIKAKFSKHYETKHRTELLCYYELQPELPGNRWLPEVETFVEANLKSSPFNRVWIYSVIKNKIIYVYPILDKSEAIRVKDVEFQDYNLRTRLFDRAKKINLMGISILTLVAIGLVLEIGLNPLFYIIASLTGIGLMFKSEEMKNADKLLSRLLIGFGQGFFIVFVIGGLFWAASSNLALFLTMINKVLSGQISVAKFLLLLFVLIGPAAILILIFRGWRGFKDFFRPDNDG